MMTAEVSLDEPGPVDYVVVGFLAGASSFCGEVAAELRAMVGSGTIRVIDVLVLTKDADGTVEATELSDGSELRELRVLQVGRGNCWPPATSSTSRPRWSREARRGARLGELVGGTLRFGGAAFGGAS